MRKIFKLYFADAEELKEGIALVSKDLFFESVEKRCADILVKVKKDEKRGVKISFDGSKATIIYGKRKSCFFRGLMLLCQALYQGKNTLEVEEMPFLERNGAMVDVARCNPLSIEGLKYFIRHSAIMGHNTLHLYLEDMFEVPEYPQFGHQRGRYTKKQLNGLTDYADALGVELIPMIEALGHLEKYLKYHSTRDIRSTPHELLADEPKTYEFIEAMIKAAHDCFPKTKSISIGIDEARTINKGRYEAIHGKVDAEELYYRHIGKVCDIAEKYGLKPIIPCDMFFQFSWKEAPPKNGYYIDESVTLTKKALDGFPKNARSQLWNYTTVEEDKMYSLFKQAQELGEDIFYLAGASMWQSLIVQYGRTVKTLVAGIPAAKRAKVKEMAFSMFEDKGETPHFFALPALFLAAEVDYGTPYDEERLDKRLMFVYGVGLKPFLDMERADKVHNNDNMELASGFMLYNDPLFGLLDKNVEGLDLKKHYGQMVKDYENINPVSCPMKLCFEQFKAMLSVLELKADFGLRLKKAYDDKDRAQLRALADEALVIADRFRHFMDADRELYSSYYRGFGLDVVEQRRATIRSRFETTRFMILKYLSGELEEIEELVNERRPFDYNPWENTCENIFFGESFNRIYSPNF